MRSRQVILLWGGIGLAGALVLERYIFQMDYFSLACAILLFADLILLKQELSKDIKAATKHTIIHPVNETKVSQELQQTLTTIANLLDQQMTTIDTEVDRASALISDAVAGMTESFKTLKNLSGDQQAMISSVLAHYQIGDKEQGTAIKAAVDDSNKMLESFLQITIANNSQSLQAGLLTNEVTLRFEGILALLKQVEKQASQTSLFTLNNAAETSKAEVGAIAQGAHALSINPTKLNDDIRQEISQTQSIIEQLKNTLETIASADMTSIIACKNRAGVMMEQVDGMNKRTDELIVELAKLSPKIVDTANIGIRCLQFEDLTHQTLDALKNNVHIIASLKEALVSFDVKKSDISQQFQTIQIQCQNLINQADQENKQRSFTQSSMDEGDVELF